MTARTLPPAYPLVWPQTRTPAGRMARTALLVLLAVMFISQLSFRAVAQDTRPGRANTFRASELVSSGHQFFGSVSRGLALTIEEATRRWGEPNGYILGQEAGGAFIGGLRYGEGVLYTRNAGPSIGWDFGGDGDRTMMLVYRMPRVDALYQRFAGIDGSAYFIGGFGMTALTANNMVIVPIRAGVGARLGVNVGYLKFTSQSTWNPF
jgi:hypothetical protein